QPGDRAAAARGVHQGPARRASLLSLPQRQHAGLEDASLHQAFRRARDAKAPRSLAGVVARRALVDQAHGGPSPPVRPAAGGHGHRDRDAARGRPASMKAHAIETRRGIRCRVFEAGSGAPLVFFHGAGGLLRDNPFLDELAKRHHVLAPEWPGYGDSTGEELLEDMLDFALHGWDVVDALGLRRPHVLGYSMGGMI